MLLPSSLQRSGPRETSFPSRLRALAAGGTGAAALAAESDFVSVCPCRGNGFVRDGSSGTLGESREGGSGHTDQPPDPAGGGDQGAGGEAVGRLKRDAGSLGDGTERRGAKGRQRGCGRGRCGAGWEEGGAGRLEVCGSGGVWKGAQIRVGAEAAWVGGEGAAIQGNVGVELGWGATG